MAGPILVLGNPPWATSSGLGASGGRNLPQKTNFQNRRGLDALTGKSNFDVAESMLLTLLEAGRRSQKAVTLAMLVKTSVARRVLSHLWTTGAPIGAAQLALSSLGEPEAAQAETRPIAAATPSTLPEMERQALLQALQLSEGNVTRAARELGISRDTLRYRMEKYGLESPARPPAR